MTVREALEEGATVTRSRALRTLLSREGRRTYYVDDTGRIGFYNAYGFVWYSWTRATGYQIAGRTRTSAGADGRRVTRRG